MYYERIKEKRSFKWLYLVILIAAVIWVMFDDAGPEKTVTTTIDVVLPK